jgi:UDP-glucose 4-epimerase
VRVVVTGGAGFIGANLCARLAAHGSVDAVVALDDLSTGYAENLQGIDAELVVGSILDTELVETLARDADAVVHLAARGSVPRLTNSAIGGCDVHAPDVATARAD